MESWRLCKFSLKCFHFWQCLGLPEWKPAVKKFWAIWTKGDGCSFYGKQCSACELQCLWFKSAINKDMAWGWLQVMQITIQRTRPAWPAKTKLWMTLDCSRIVKEITWLVKLLSREADIALFLQVTRIRKTRKNLRSKLVDDCPKSSFHNGRYVMGHTSKTRKQCVCWYIWSLLHVNRYLNFPYEY